MLSQKLEVFLIKIKKKETGEWEQCSKARLFKIWVQGSKAVSVIKIKKAYWNRLLPRGLPGRDTCIGLESSQGESEGRRKPAI